MLERPRSLISTCLTSRCITIFTSKTLASRGRTSYASPLLESVTEESPHLYHQRASRQLYVSRNPAKQRVRNGSSRQAAPGHLRVGQGCEKITLKYSIYGPIFLNLRRGIECRREFGFPRDNNSKKKNLGILGKLPCNLRYGHGSRPLRFTSCRCIEA